MRMAFAGSCLNSGSPTGVSLGRIGKRGLPGGGESLEAGFEFQKSCANLSVLVLPLACGSRCELSTAALASCLCDTSHAPCYDGHGL